jgi:acetyl-CoA carboxylase carboxyl transferase subunit alpha
VAEFFLEFEKPVVELERKIEELRGLAAGSVRFDEEIKTLEKKAKKLQAQIFSELTPWQKTQLSRHPNQPYTRDYADRIFKSFEELHGDRNFMDDASILTGLADFDGQTVAVIGHQKGRNTKENLARNFGMPRPEGYRKALRLMSMAERFKLPILTFIDTPGAYPGIGAEERGQAEAIAKNLLVLS